MKVLYLINYAGKGGSEKYVENLVRLLSAKGTECHLAYNIPGGLSEKLDAASVPLLHLEMGTGRLLSAAVRLARYCRQNAIDVIHAQYPVENITAILSTFIYPHPKVVYTSHLSITQGPRWRLLNRLFTGRDHAVLAVCDQGAGLLAANGFKKERIRVVYNGVEPAPPPVRTDTVRQEFFLEPGCFVMTILARYSPEKGLEFLLDALSELRKRTDEPFVCLIAGEGNGFESVRRRVGELGLLDRVIQAGYRGDTAELLRGSDAYLCSSSSEAMSIAILEAMSCGLPLVVTDVGANRDLAETGLRCGFAVSFGDVNGFADACLRLMEDKLLREQLSAAAYRKATTDFDLNKIADKIYDIYCEGEAK